jgi:hypothetical protein
MITVAFLLAEAQTDVSTGRVSCDEKVTNRYAGDGLLGS